MKYINRLIVSCNGENMRENNKNKKDFEFINEIIGNEKKRGMKWLIKIVIITMFGGVIIGAFASVLVSVIIPQVMEYVTESEEYRYVINDKVQVKPIDGKDINDIEEMKEYLKNEIFQVISTESNKKWQKISKNITSAVAVYVSEKKIIFVADGKDIDESDNVRIVLGDGKEYDAKLLKKDDITGVTSLVIDSTILPETVRKNIKIPYIQDKELKHNGNSILVVGIPYNEGKKVFEGKITSMDSPIEKIDGIYMNCVTDITVIDRMNGFVFGTDGSLLGIMLGELQNELTSGKIAATLIVELKNRIQNVCSGINPPVLGINGDTVDDEVRAAIDKKMPYGVYVKSCMPDSVAYKGGILNGDIIVSLNGDAVKDMRDLKQAMDGCVAENGVEIIVMRKGKDEYKEIKYNIKLE